MDEEIDLGNSNYNIEVNFDEFESGRRNKEDLQEEKSLAGRGPEGGDVTVNPEEPLNPCVEEKKPKRRSLFRLRRKEERLSETDAVVALEDLEEEPKVDDSRSKEQEDDPGTNSLFMWTRKRQSFDRQRSYIYEEEDPQQRAEDAESDEEGLRQAETAEGLLGSALRLAERERGESIFSLSRSPRSAAMEFGRQVSALAIFPGVAGEHNQDQIGRSPSILSVDDQLSVHSMNSQVNATTFIKVPKVDPSTINQGTWETIMTSLGPLYSLSADDSDDVIYDSADESKEGRELFVRDIPASPLRSAKPPDSDRLEAAAETAQSRKWDKLRDTLEAQEKGNSVGYGAQFDSQRRKSRSARRMGTLRKVLCPSIGGGLCVPRKNPIQTPDSNDFSEVLGPLPDTTGLPVSYPQTVEKSFDVNIKVEDLSKSAAILDTSGDTDLESDEEEQQQPTLLVDKVQDLEEAESMEVVYLGSEDAQDTEDISPPFPSRLVFAL